MSLNSYVNVKLLQQMTNLLQVLRALCYSTKLIGGLCKDELHAKRFAAFSSQMSNARAVLRLLDDLPMLQYTIEYGLGKHVSII